MHNTLDFYGQIVEFRGELVLLQEATKSKCEEGAAVVGPPSTLSFPDASGTRAPPGRDGQPAQGPGPAP